MPLRRSPRKWIWALLVIQVFGLTFDAVWHGLNPSFEATTFGQMVTHLSTVHLPIYIGVVGVLLTSSWALVDQMRRSKVGVALPAAFVGALVSTAGEGWHAYGHLQLSARSGPIAETVAIWGFIVVVVALWLAERRGLRHSATGIDGRREA